MASLEGGARRAKRGARRNRYCLLLARLGPGPAARLGIDDRGAKLRQVLNQAYGVWAAVLLNRKRLLPSAEPTDRADPRGAPTDHTDG